ncbi:MAG TPA: DUF455 family protein [Polyangiaceae bacterium]|jgi:uncharacterized ferritin-like protein (DUF455 family)|nr:DUF455 family protein [Polyangiaceae bacterium]
MSVPVPGTLQAWAYEYISSSDLALKCAPPAAPSQLETVAVSRDLREPGRPSELTVSMARPRALRAVAMQEPVNRAKLLHKFWHHELQAAELMCWAILRFPDAPPEFLHGLARIAHDEVRHMAMYQRHIESLGFRVGAFPVRDWFWERVPTCESPVSFVALLGMGLEAANLDHTPRFADWFRRVGDEAGAVLQEQVGREEVAHVRFGVRWFKRWTGGMDFEKWQAALPPPLTPLLMRGKSVQRSARLKAEMGEDFVSQLVDWKPLL